MHFLYVVDYFCSLNHHYHFIQTQSLDMKNKTLLRSIKRFSFLLTITFTPLSKITLFNTIGQVSKTIHEVNNSSISLDVGDLPEGIYFLKVDNYSLKKVVIQRW